MARFDNPMARLPRYDSSIITLENVMKDPVAGFPSSAEVSAKLELYQSIVNSPGLGFPSGLSFQEPSGTSPGGFAIAMELTSWARGGFSRNDQTLKMLDRYADIMGETMPREIKDAMSGLDTSFVFDLADSVIGKWINTGSELMTQAIANVPSGAAGGVQAFGTASIKLGTMTAEAIRSGGYATDKEIMAISMTTGATIGGAIGSIFPGVGTAIGTAIGTAVGAFVGWVTGLTTKPPWKAEEARQTAAAAAALVQLKTLCGVVENEVNDYIFQEVFKISTRWINAERTLGYRFPLRWFDSNPGIRFEGKAQMGRPFLDKLMGTRSTDYSNNLTPTQTQDGYDYPYGKFKCNSTYKRRQGLIDYRNREYRSMGGEITGMCNFYCPEHILGCLYPPPSGNQFHAYGSPRVLAAFWARGFSIPHSFKCRDWLPVTGNPSASDDIVKISSYDTRDRGKKGERALESYKEAMAKAIESQFKNKPKRYADTAISNFQTAATIVSTDLTRTISLMQSKQNILLNRVALEGQGVITDVTTTFVAAKNQHARRMRNISLIGGASLMGLAAWRATR